MSNDLVFILAKANGFEKRTEKVVVLSVNSVINHENITLAQAAAYFKKAET